MTVLWREAAGLEGARVRRFSGGAHFLQNGEHAENAAVLNAFVAAFGEVCWERALLIYAEDCRRYGNHFYVLHIQTNIYISPFVMIFYVSSI